MNILIAKSLCAIFFSGNALAYGHGSENLHLSGGEHLTAKNFEHCTFNFNDTTYFSHLPPDEPGSSIEDDDSCAIRLNSEKNGTYTDMISVWVSMFTPNQLEKIMSSQGFYKDKMGDWKFNGYPMGVYFVSFKNFLFEQRKFGDDTILVGRQIENAKDQAGTPMTFEGVHILRVTPLYLVSMDFAFEFQLESATRDALVNDMIKLVESVHVTASSFPVIR